MTPVSPDPTGAVPAARPVHVQTIRLSLIMAEQIEQIARTEGKTVSAVIREAIAAHIERRKADPEFQRRLREWDAKHRAMVERLTA